MTLDQPWKIAALIGLLACLRIVWGLWREAPGRTFMVELLDSGLIAFVLVFVLIRPLVVQAFFIPSASMEPTLMEHDRILVNKFIYRLNPPQRGDIIVFDAPPQALRGRQHKDFVKRLVGLPGDVIRVRRGEGVFVNDARLLDPPGIPLPNYDWPLDEFGAPDGSGYRVPEECYFVLGDNRNDSNDSHSWQDPVSGGPRPAVEARRLIGKAMVIFWPPTRIGLTGDSSELGLASGPELASAGAAPATAP